MPVLNNARHEAFAKAYALGPEDIRFNQTKAALSVGYAKSSAHVRGSELVKNSKVSARIDELQGRAADKAVLSIPSLLDKLKTIMEDESSSEPARLKAIDLYGKHLGMFEERVKVIHNAWDTEPQDKVDARMAEAETELAGELGLELEALRDSDGAYSVPSTAE